MHAMDTSENVATGRQATMSFFVAWNCCQTMTSVTITQTLALALAHTHTISISIVMTKQCGRANEQTNVCETTMIIITVFGNKHNIKRNCSQTMLERTDCTENKWEKSVKYTQWVESRWYLYWVCIPKSWCVSAASVSYCLHCAF